MKKGRIIALGVVIVVLLACGLAGAAVFGKIGNIHDDQVQIVQKADTVQVPESSVDETLEAVEGTPADIDEDHEPEIPEDVVLEAAPIYEAVPIDENVINILVVGQDSGLEWNRSTRSDSCMIISYNRSQGTAKVVSVLRDTWVPIEGHGWNRINAAYSFGGIGLLINTINEVYGLDIQNYVITGFDEFQQIVDKMGGLDIEITEKEAQKIGAALEMDLEAGMTHMDGRMTLAYSRNRRTGDGDFGRAGRQRKVLQAAFQKLKKANDPIACVALFYDCLDNVKTNMDTKELLTLGMEVLKAEKFSIKYGRLPFDDTWTYASKNGKAVLSVDNQKNGELLREFLYGSDEE